MPLTAGIREVEEEIEKQGIEIAFRKIAEETIGRPLKISQMCGGTDARMFADRSVIVMHSVNGENAHGDGEYVEIESVKKLLEIEKKYIDTCIAGI